MHGEPARQEKQKPGAPLPSCARYLGGTTPPRVPTTGYRPREAPRPARAIATHGCTPRARCLLAFYVGAPLVAVPDSRCLRHSSPAVKERQDRTGQNRTKQTKAQKQAKQTKKTKPYLQNRQLISACGSRAGQRGLPAERVNRQIHNVESTSRSYCTQSPWQGTANLQLVRTHMCTPTVGENDEPF